MRQSSEDSSYALQIRGSEKYADLRMVQLVLLEPLAEALAKVIRERARNGELRFRKHHVGDN